MLKTLTQEVTPSNTEELPRDGVKARATAPADNAVDIPPAYVPETEKPDARMKWEARNDLDRHRADTERLKVLVDFLARPIHAHGGADPDPDIVTAYNLAVEAALQGIRRAACSE